MQDENFESRSASIDALLRSALAPEEDGGTWDFTVEETNVLMEFVTVRGAYQYAKEHAVEARENKRFWKTAESIYQHELEAELFAVRIEETVHRRHKILTGLIPYAQTPRDTLLSMTCPSTMPQQSFADFLELLCLTL